MFGEVFEQVPLVSILVSKMFVVSQSEGEFN